MYDENITIFNLIFVWLTVLYSETCLNQTLSKPKTCLNQTKTLPIIQTRLYSPIY